MDRKLSDEQLDRIAKNLLQDFAPDAETLDEIAGSPQIWWGVRSRIETEKAARARGWFAALRVPALAFGALAILICGGLAILFLSLKNNPNPLASEPNGVRNPVEKSSEKPKEVANIYPDGDSQSPENSPKLNPVPEKLPVKTAVPKPNLVAKNKRVETTPKPAANSSAKTVSPNRAEETKTDFIALSYAANTDSGQIVRVKVPSSMMVSLGVATNVEKGSELVSAEVVIGDDGLARAIRFIR